MYSYIVKLSKSRKKKSLSEKQKSGIPETGEATGLWATLVTAWVASSIDMCFLTNHAVTGLLCVNTENS